MGLRHGESVEGITVLAPNAKLRYQVIALGRLHDEFEVETDKKGEPPFSFWSATVRRVVVE